MMGFDIPSPSEWLSELFTDMVNEIFSIFDAQMLNLLNDTLRIEHITDGIEGFTVLSDTQLSELYTFMYMVACALMGLKFLSKGFQIYILWRDGDPDNPPTDMLIGAVQAVFVMISFPILYEYMANISIYLATGIMGKLGGYESLGLSGVVDALIGALSGLVGIIILLIYAIMVFFLWLTLLKRGMELLVLRMGVPLACIGLLDSDMGVFKNYMQTFSRTLLTTILQIVLMSASIRLVTSFNIILILLGIGTVMATFSVPSLLQQFLIATGGGGGLTSKIYSASMVAGGIRKILGR